VTVKVAGPLLEELPEPVKPSYEPVNAGTEPLELDAVTGEPPVELEDVPEVPGTRGKPEKLTEPYPPDGP